MKYKIVRKNLLKESATIAGVLVLLAASLYFLISWHDDKEQENRNLQTELTSLKNEMQSLDSKYTNWRQNNSLYEEALAKNKSSELSISRGLIRDLFDRYRNQFALRNVSLQMQPVQPISLPEYNRQNFNMVYSEVTISFDALTDLDVYRLISALQSDLSGKIKMLSFSVIKKNNLTKEAATDIATKGTVNMVSASMRLLWVGIAQAEEASGGGANAPATP